MNTLTEYKIMGALLCLWILTACGHKQTRGQHIENNIAEHFLTAYNAHDQQKMLSLVHPEIKYMYVDSGQIYTETNSKQKLADFLVGYFNDTPAAQSNLISTKQQGPFIQQIEEAIWVDKNGEKKSQCSLSVYEVKDQLIINIWYFTAFKCSLP